MIVIYPADAEYEYKHLYTKLIKVRALARSYLDSAMAVGSWISSATISTSETIVAFAKCRWKAVRGLCIYRLRLERSDQHLTVIDWKGFELRMLGTLARKSRNVMNRDCQLSMLWVFLFPQPPLLIATTSMVCDSTLVSPVPSWASSMNICVTYLGFLLFWRTCSPVPACNGCRCRLPQSGHSILKSHVNTKHLIPK